MVYSYFPGCTLKTKAKDLDRYGRESAKALGFELEEIENWQCCGGVYPLGTDEIASKLSSVRALNDAKEKGQDLVTLCSACHHVIKRVNDDMKNVEDIRTRANNYMQLEQPYEGETNVLHYLEVLRDRVGFDELKKKVEKNPDNSYVRFQFDGAWQPEKGKQYIWFLEENEENGTITYAPINVYEGVYEIDQDIVKRYNEENTNNSTTRSSQLSDDKMTLSEMEAKINQ